ncbi:MAG: C40 family peptidase [Muribaculaceae bacterium]|nr:C40 family peptidase [Muribaculaceae bacterium]
MKKLLSIATFLFFILSLTATNRKTTIDNIALPQVPVPENIFTEMLSAPSVDEAEEEEEGMASDSTNELAESIKAFAARYLGTKYVWGATGPKNFDCSGFTSYIFKNHGINLHRTSKAQYTQGTKVAHKEWKTGDLLFFSSARSGKGRVGHVAMVVDVNPDGSCTFIHASTKRGVVYQKFPDGGYYSRNYIGAKRVIEA